MSTHLDMSIYEFLLNDSHNQVSKGKKSFRNTVVTPTALWLTPLATLPQDAGFTPSTHMLTHKRVFQGIQHSL